MNRYPLWKYVLILAVVLVGSLYALPNLYGKDPAVQVSVRRGDIDTGTLDAVRDGLEAEGIAVKAVELLNNTVIARLQSLQNRVQFAARWDVEPKQLRDYHTVELGQPKMCEPGWTTRGTTEHRAGGASAKFGTHQRYRHYWANGVMTLALSLAGEGDPTLDELETALKFPARPLFLGRKTCLPTAPILLERVHAHDLFQAISSYPLHSRCRVADHQFLSACWPSGLSPAPHGRSVLRYDLREWRNQIHVGRREHQEGVIGRPSR